MTIVSRGCRGTAPTRTPRRRRTCRRRRRPNSCDRRFLRREQWPAARRRSHLGLGRHRRPTVRQPRRRRRPGPTRSDASVGRPRAVIGRPRPMAGDAIADHDETRHAAPADLAVGRVRRRRPVGARPRRDRLVGGRRAAAPPGPPARCPSLIAPGRLPAGAAGRRRRRPARPAPSCRGCGGARRGRAGRAGRASPSCPGACALAAEALGPTFIKLGQIISSGEGVFPHRARRGVQALPRPGAGRDVRRRPPDRRGRPRPAARRGVRVVRPRPARRRLDRPGPRRPPAHRRGRRRQGPAPRRRPPRAHRPAGDGLAGPAPRRADPGRRARQPAGARRAVRRHDRRGARLPRRGRQHARRRHDAPRPRPDRLRRAPPPPRRSSRAGCS